MDTENTYETAEEQETSTEPEQTGSALTDTPSEEDTAATDKQPDALSEDGVAEAIARELSMINALDPTVNSFDDILSSDTAGEFTEKVKRGYSLYDAYLVTNQKKILRSVSDAVRQAALNSVNSKSHLTGTGASKAENLTEVPSKTYSLYKAMFPGLSDHQIIAHYAKHNKHNG